MGSIVNWFYHDDSVTLSSPTANFVSFTIPGIPNSRVPVVNVSAIHDNSNFNVFIDEMHLTFGYWFVKIRASTGTFPVGTVVHIRAFARC